MTEVTDQDQPHRHEDETRWTRLTHALSHRHEHSSPTVTDFGLEGIRATKFSLAGLGITALLQAAIVVVSGSVALLSDTIHNLGDALTASRSGSRSLWVDAAQPAPTPMAYPAPRISLVFSSSSPSEHPLFSSGGNRYSGL